MTLDEQKLIIEFRYLIKREIQRKMKCNSFLLLLRLDVEFIIAFSLGLNLHEKVECREVRTREGVIELQNQKDTKGK
tara:strand:+ start:250 stop:480 length:231 start_codon:yes stop_codon:yes gene_type:complete